MCVSALFISANLFAAPNQYTEILQFGQSSIQCGPAIVNAMFTLSENQVYYDCKEREFKIKYFQTTSDYMKCVGYDYSVYSRYLGGTAVLETSGYFGNNIFSLPPIISTTFTILKHQNEENYEYFIVLEYKNPSGCEGWGMDCGYLATTSSPLFTPNWEALPLLSERPFNLDNTNSQGVQASFITKCNGDAMNFSLTQIAVNDLNCNYNNSIGGNVSCASQYAGLKITKVDAALNPIDNHKFIGTQEWINSLNLPAGYPDIIIEDFIDYNNLAENIPLLPLFGNYMTNNFGYYELEFTYRSLCGDYTETMLIEYGTTYKPTFNFNTMSGASGSMVQVPSNTSLSNPHIGCQNSSLLSFSNIPSGILQANGLNIKVERYDNNTLLNEGTIVDITFANWSSANNINLELFADGVITNPSNAFADNLNNWAGLNGIYTFLENAPGWSGITAAYPDNQDDIYKVTIGYTTTCGTETAEMWFTPTTATCKKIDNEEVSVKVESIIYPNPVSNELNISFHTVDEQSAVNIYNVTGQNVFNKSYNANTFKVDEKLDLGFLDDGIYFLQMKSINGVETHRVVKQ